ncbi:MAG: DnaJ domain-containing protein [Anaeromyxobacter sp.]
MSFLHEPGDLSRTPLAAILLEALNLRATGALEVAHGDGTSRLWLRDGRPAGAQVVTGVKPLGHLLLQAGRIDIDALSRSLATMAESGRPQGDILVEMGAVTRDEVDRALVEQQAGYFDLIAQLDAGVYRFDPALPVPNWARNLLSPLRTIVDALERPQAGALVISALQPVAAGSVRLASGYAEVARSFRWGDTERQLVARLESPTSLEAFFGTSGIAPERARAMLAALLLLGLAVPADGGGRTGETAAGLDLGDRPTLRPGAATPPPAPAPPGRRSDPAEARARRQKLLQQAMRNMGIGPFGGAGRPVPPPGAAAPSPGPAASAPAPPPAAAPGSPEASLRAALAGVMPRAREKNLFARLGLQETAGREEVKAAFLGLAKQFHPDRFAAPSLQDLAEQVKDLFTAVNEAYEVLADDKRRAEYLASRRQASAAAGSSAPDEGARVDFQKGEACLRTRDFVKARSFFEAALRADRRAEYQAALALAIVNDPACRERDRARTLADEAAKDPACDRGLYVAGILARDDKDDVRAEKLFRAAVTANPRNVDAVRELRLLERRKR